MQRSPYLNESTGQFYIVGGDENFPWGVQATKNKPSNPRGAYHFMNFPTLTTQEKTQYMKFQKLVHIIFGFMVIFYLLVITRADLRVVDISGELLGDIYKQGREIAHYLSYHEDGRIPNAPMVWGAQPYKNYIFFSDMNSGLYCVELEDEKQAVLKVNKTI